ncbi:hypothetical protein HYZ97_00620 [Candidatus Pacearchaeota archaeon]|nr:hypothetical protein [Candidatus Pacearchaeota archaeon]
MVNKKGWLRIVEAIVAVLIILTSVLIVLANKKVQEEGDVCTMIPELLDEIAKNQTLREEILNGDVTGTTMFLQTQIRNPALNFEVRSCEPDDLCGLVQGEADQIDICAGERIISTTRGQSEFNPKKLKLFLFKVPV